MSLLDKAQGLKSGFHIFADVIYMVEMCNCLEGHYIKGIAKSMPKSKKITLNSGLPL